MSVYYQYLILAFEIRSWIAPTVR